jgi:hypothetical protein
MELDGCAGPPKPCNNQALTVHLQEDGSSCSIFSFDVTANKSRLPLAKNALKKLRTLRHPGVIKVLDTVEVRHHSTHTMGPSLMRIS